MRYVVRIEDSEGGGWWLAAVMREDAADIPVTDDPEAAVQYVSPEAAAQEIVRVSAVAPLTNPRGPGPGILNMPLRRAGARVQRRDEAREESHGSRG